MKIQQFFYGSDNLAYLLHHAGSALVIDGGAVEAILAYVRDHDLILKAVTNTHGHGDHTTGTRQLVAASGAEHLDHQRFIDGETIDLAGAVITVRRTPGHTMDSVTFCAGDLMITGDTLFNGTVGNCFSGDIAAFYCSIRLLMDYPASTRVYAGHDYVTASLAFARHLMPGNRAIDDYATRYDKRHVVSTLAEELAVNPYLRFNEPDIIALLQSHGRPTETEYQRWEGVMALE